MRRRSTSPLLAAPATRRPPSSDWACWQQVFIDENYARGYVSELQDFMECVAYGRQPLSGFDLAYDTAKVVYAAYLSAEEGVRVKL